MHHLLDCESGRAEYWMDKEPAPTGNETRKARKNRICLLEAQAVLRCIKIWQEDMEGRDITFYVDNESAQAATCRGWSTNEEVSAVCAEIWRCLATFGCRAWFERVASASNIADAPSRGRHLNMWQVKLFHLPNSPRQHQVRSDTCSIV